jgi:DNA recombination protein RmuC
VAKTTPVSAACHDWSMSSLISLLAALGGLLLGLALGLAISRSRLLSSQAHVELLTEQISASARQREEDERLGSLMDSLQGRIKELQTAAARAERERVSSDAKIAAQIEGMKESNKSLATETAKLAGALGNASTRGRFGEMQLEQLLSHSGLLLDVHYSKQASSSDGSQRPDITIHLPSGGEIFVDSKFPFDRFWEAAGADDLSRKGYLSAHAKDLLEHASALSKRGYHKKDSSPDFVVLFAPVESILSLALDAEPRLLDKMFEKNVVVATPTTMLALLRTIGYGYSRRDLAENAAQIRDLANELLKRIGTVHTKLQTLGDRIKTTVNGFNELVATTENSVLVPARKMVQLGVPSPRPLPAIESIEPSVRDLKRVPAELGDGSDEE